MLTKVHNSAYTTTSLHTYVTRITGDTKVLLCARGQTVSATKINVKNVIVMPTCRSCCCSCLNWSRSCRCSMASFSCHCSLSSCSCSTSPCSCLLRLTAVANSSRSSCVALASLMCTLELLRLTAGALRFDAGLGVTRRDDFERLRGVLDAFTAPDFGGTLNETGFLTTFWHKDFGSTDLSTLSFALTLGADTFGLVNCNFRAASVVFGAQFCRCLTAFARV